MHRFNFKSLGLLAFAACAASASAQAGYDPACWPPMSDTGPSTDYIVYNLPEDTGSDNPLFAVAVGASGTNTYGKQCVPPNGATFNTSGRIGFSIGSVGSFRTDFDNFLRLQFGMPFMVGGSIGFGMITDAAIDGTGFRKTLYADVDTAFVGASDRFCITQGTYNDFRVQQRVDNVGDGVRLNWTITNTAAEALQGGLWFGQQLALLDANGQQLDAPYVYSPGYKPFTTARRFRRVSAPTDIGGRTYEPMPEVINFAPSQTNFYGLQVVNTARIDNGVAVSDQSPVDELCIGNAYGGFPLLSGSRSSNTPTMPDANNPQALIGFPDGYLQKWDPEIIQPGATREINGWYKSTWSNSNFARPFSAVIDAPNLIATDNANPNQFDSNPFTIRVWVDNTRGFATVDREFALNNVRVELNLPPGMSDANDATAVQMVQTIPVVSPKQFGFVDFRVRASTDVNGILPYTVKITNPAGANKSMTGTINVASTPKLNLPSTANLITAPWNFANGSWEAVLGMTVDQDFQAFNYDPDQREYVISTGPSRGRGTWIVTSSAKGIVTLGGTPTLPTDLPRGGLQVQLSEGWNLISNPYNYALPIGQLIGVSAANAAQSFSYRELVDQGIIGSSLAYWDASSPTPEYKFIGADTDLLLPNRGYWVFLNTAQVGTLQFPAVFEPFLPGAARGTSKTSNNVKANDWQLQFTARNDKFTDSQNFIGVGKSAKDAKVGRVYEPPVAPLKGALSLGIVQTVDSKEQTLSRALSETTGRQEFKLKVYSRDAGPVTITWPNLNSVPKNMQFKLIDPATNTTKNLRRSSGFTYDAEARVNRTFTLVLEPGVASRPVIGAITATRSSRTANAPMVLNYSLSSEATVTVRILSGGKEVFAAAQARVSKAGQNSVVWNLRDNANRIVAPGPYTVEIVAESDNGERVRKFYPITITR